MAASSSPATTADEEAIIRIFVEQPDWVPGKITRDGILEELRQNGIKTVSEFYQAVAETNILNPFMRFKLRKYFASNPPADAEAPGPTPIDAGPELQLSDDEQAIVNAFEKAVRYRLTVPDLLEYLRNQDPSIRTLSDLAEAVAQKRLKPGWNVLLSNYFQAHPPPLAASATSSSSSSAASDLDELKDLAERAGVKETQSLKFASFGIRSVADLSNILQLDQSKRPQNFPGSWVGRFSRVLQTAPASQQAPRAFQAPVGITFTVIEGRLELNNADALVNPANSRLEHGAGAARAISDAAGPRLQKDSEEVIRARGEIPVGQSVVTPGHRLKAKFVIHTVGPRCLGSKPTRREEHLLRSAVRTALRCALEKKVRSVAMPSISTGIFGYPPEEGIRTIVSEAVDFANKVADQPNCSLHEIRFIDLSSAKCDIWRRELARARNQLPDTPTEEEQEEIPLEILGFTLLENLQEEQQNILAINRNPQAYFDKNILGADWKMRLKAPPTPPPLPLVELKKGDPKYAQVLALIPSSHHNIIYSIREINVPLQLAKYNREKAANKKGTIWPLFHGTPQRWRASAIALNGFNLGIRTHGRALGDGVYSATTTATPMGYTGGQKGTLILMEGLDSDKVIKNPNDATWRIFPNADHVSPRFLIDFSDSQDDKNAELAKLAQEAEEERQAFARMKAEMARNEAHFHTELFERWRATVHFYSERIDGFLQQYLEDPTNEENVRRITHLFAREKYQFESRLPIYALKSRVVDEIKKNDVVVIISGTGSGKSTQLPQYILDEVAPPGEKRRVAVLQPRRVNCTQLSARVAKERGSKPGEEVGYRLGGGDYLVSEEKTKIEFITHGLFVQLAQSPERLLASYFAIVLDEAHERHVDVDLSLALLRDLLSSQPAGSNALPKVVVASATIEGKGEALRAFLDHRGDRSVILRAEGLNFPVYTQYQKNVMPPEGTVGSGGVGNILSSAAAQAAFDLVLSTETGNVLVFLPGKSHIIHSLRQIYQVVVASTDQSGDADQQKVNIPNRVFASGFSYVPHSPQDSGSSTASSSSFARTPTGRGRRQVVREVPFYGGMDSETTSRFLNPDNSERVVIFTTNVAETGLTIPNIRYVIDTGLERSLMWSPSTNARELVTQRISQSSADQRKGRAGRIASGICVRLYSEESYKRLRQDGVPDIQKTDILKAALLLQSREEEGKPLSLLVPPSPEHLAGARDALQTNYSALDSTTGRLTRKGSLLVQLGLTPRYGSFLLQCAKNGCTLSGAYIVAMLMSDAALEVLPSSKSEFEVMSELVDSQSDHLTLLNILMEFVESEDKSWWCKQYEVDFDAMTKADQALETLLDKLATLELDTADEPEIYEAKGLTSRSAIIRSLCQSHIDQIVSISMPGHQPNKDVHKGLGLRVVSTAQEARITEATKRFKERLQSGLDDNSAQIPGVGPDAECSPLLVKLSSSSVLHFVKPFPSSERKARFFSLESLGSFIGGAVDAVTEIFSSTSISASSSSSSSSSSLSSFTASRSSPSASSDQNSTPYVFALYSVVVQTDTSGCPTVDIVTYISQEELDACRADLDTTFAQDLHSKVLNSSRMSRKISFVTRAEREMTEKILRQLSRRYSDITWKQISSDTIKISASRARMPLIVKKFCKNKPVSMTLDVPDAVNMNQLIGAGGSGRMALEDQLNEQLSALLGPDSLTSEKLARVQMVKDPNRISLTLSPKARAFAGVALGVVRSYLARLGGDVNLDHQPLVMTRDCITADMPSPLDNPRLGYLTADVPPPKPTDRDSALQYLVWLVLRRCNLKVYGGFVRDWVFRGESANDVDCICPNSQRAAATAILKAEAPSSIVFVKEQQKGAAHTLFFQFGTQSDQNKPIEIDLVDPGTVAQSGAYTNPGVDCDVGNLALKPPGVPCLKVEKAGLEDLNTSILHCMAKEFVYYYSPTAKCTPQRLGQKYLARGWTLLNTVDCPTAKQFPRLCKPAKGNKYDKKYYELS